MSFIKGLNDIDNNIKLQKFEGKNLTVNKPETLESLDASSSRMRICFLDLEFWFGLGILQYHQKHFFDFM